MSSPAPVPRPCDMESPQPTKRSRTIAWKAPGVDDVLYFYSKSAPALPGSGTNERGSPKKYPELVALQNQWLLEDKAGLDAAMDKATASRERCKAMAATLKEKRAAIALRRKEHKAAPGMAAKKPIKDAIERAQKDIDHCEREQKQLEKDLDVQLHSVDKHSRGWRKVLSNFDTSDPFLWHGLTWPSIEHAFQAWKFIETGAWLRSNPGKTREEAVEATHRHFKPLLPIEAKKAGRHYIALTPDEIAQWSQHSKRVMRDITLAKVEHLILLEWIMEKPYTWLTVLRATHDAELWHSSRGTVPVRFTWLEEARQVALAKVHVEPLDMVEEEEKKADEMEQILIQFTH